MKCRRHMNKQRKAGGATKSTSDRLKPEGHQWDSQALITRNSETQNGCLAPIYPESIQILEHASMCRPILIG